MTQPQQQVYSGEVRRGPFGTGSKSEHAAVMLATVDQEYVLRRQGGNAFSDPTLEGLVGKRIRCHGFVHGYTLIISDWEQTLDP